jgi:polyisoprenoid-binding protein YceI
LLFLFFLSFLFFEIMFSNNFKWAFFVILFALFGVLVKFDPMNWWGTYDIDQSMVATIITRKSDAITTLPEGTNYDVASGSTLTWEARKVGGFHTGTLSITDGVVVVASGELVGAKFNINMVDIVVSDIPAGDAMNTKLVGELKSFFNVTTYPTATFFLTSYASGQAQWDLTLNGITKSIQFPATIVVSGQTTTIQADFFIQRSQWNLTKWQGMVQEELKIAFDLVTTTTDIVEATTASTGSVTTGSVSTGGVSTGTTSTGTTSTGTTTTDSTTGKTIENDTGSTEDDIIEILE